MRLFIVDLLIAGLLLFSASSASALALSLVAMTGTTLNIGENVTMELRLDTEGETNLTSLFASVGNDNPGTFPFVSGTSPGQILFNTSTFEGVARVSQPVADVPGDAPGRVRAASFATSNPTGSGVSSANQLLATLTFIATGLGVANIVPLLIVGSDEVTVNQISVTGSVRIAGPVSITVIPEPSTALLMGLGLAGLAGAGRCRTA
ncbi:MAG: PEP-CTERM sorting domain-containing protein [Deltaproteobacteria bacterium]|nr:PEP-CTERM sorting domain-containing protein [Deltaproteobacteria bacterium]